MPLPQEGSALSATVGSVLPRFERPLWSATRYSSWGHVAAPSPPRNGRRHGEAEILHIHEALIALEAAELRLAKVVEMRYFAGYTELEIAEALDLTERTVRRDWEKVRLLLMHALKT
jgi:DNA-directed RNA polymerase specialized sigma24 family protein